jgi:hypothetical protein
MGKRADHPRYDVVSFRVTPAEKALIDMTAHRRQISRQAILREIVMRSDTIRKSEQKIEQKSAACR